MNSPINTSACACLGSGWRVLAGSFPQELIPCPECNVAAEKQQIKAAAQLAKLRNELGELAHCTFDTFDLDRTGLRDLHWNAALWQLRDQRRLLKEALARCIDYANAPTGWLYLAGPYGAGKSHLAAAIAHDVAARGDAVAYASVPEYLRYIRAGFRSRDEREAGERTDADERVSALQRIGLLVLDDLGAEKRSDWVEETLFVLINYRYLHALPTVITSNFGLDAHEGRIASRIAGLATEIVVPVADYRRRER